MQYPYYMLSYCYFKLSRRLKKVQKMLSVGKEVLQRKLNRLQSLGFAQRNQGLILSTRCLILQ